MGSFSFFGCLLRPGSLKVYLIVNLSTVTAPPCSTSGPWTVVTKS